MTMSNFKNLLNFKVARYQRIGDNEEGQLSDEKLPLAEASHATSSPITAPPRHNKRWMIATAVSTGLAILFFVRSIQHDALGTFQRGYVTELSLATPSIQVSQVKFTGGIKFHPNGTMYRDNGPGPSYVGPPSPEIDANWKALISTRYLAFTAEQASSLQVSPSESSADGLYRAGPDVLHSLHCVDKLRQTIDGYMYGPKDKVDESRANVLHLEHCIDFLRQLVMCTSDLTPIPLVYSDGAGFPVPDFEQTHTCREFTPIHHWAVRQNTETLRAVGKEPNGVGIPIPP